MFLFLLTLVAAALFWPKQPIWRQGKEEVIGFDKAQQVLFTTVVNKDGLHLHEYSVANGELQRSRALIAKSIEPKVSDTGTTIFPYWLSILSNDSKTIVCYRKESITTFDVETCGLVATMETPEQVQLYDDFGGLNALNISSDGQLIAAEYSGTIYLWNAWTGKFLFKLPTPTVAKGFAMTGFIECESRRIAFSRDHRFLAIATRERDIVIVELESKKEIVRIAKVDMPYFLPDGSLIASCGFGHGLQYKQYRFEGDKFVEQFAMKEIPEELILAVNSRGVLTGQINPVELPKWFPDSIRKWWRGREMTVSIPMQLKWWQWCQTQPTLQTTINVKDYFGNYTRMNYGRTTTFSMHDNDCCVVIHDQNDITNWSLTGWSWFRWTFFVVSLLLIVVIFRPRKVIPSGSRSL
ncbi:MAG: hypothetical protein QM703_04040 [Gemmatales bacterium]